MSHDCLYWKCSQNWEIDQSHRFHYVIWEIGLSFSVASLHHKRQEILHKKTWHYCSITFSQTLGSRVARRRQYLTSFSNQSLVSSNDISRPRCNKKDWYLKLNINPKTTDRIYKQCLRSSSPHSTIFVVHRLVKLPTLSQNIPCDGCIRRPKKLPSLMVFNRRGRVPFRASQQKKTFIKLDFGNKVSQLLSVNGLLAEGW